jgi:hypothetical protein
MTRQISVEVATEALSLVSQYTGVSKFGVSHKVGFSRGSGSDDTSWANTLNTTFFCYLMFRLSGDDYETAYRRIYFCAGDDVVSESAFGNHMKDAADILGFTAKILSRPLGDAFTFLGNAYMPSDLGYNVVPCTKRKLIALGISVLRYPDNVTKLYKAEAFLETYGDGVPLLSSLARKMVKFNSSATRHSNYDLLEREVNWRKYVFDEKSFCYHSADTPAHRRFVCDELGIDEQYLCDLEDLVEAAESEDELPSKCFKWSIDVPSRCVLFGDVVLQPPDKYDETQEQTPDPEGSSSNCPDGSVGTQ